MARQRARRAGRPTTFAGDEKGFEKEDLNDEEMMIDLQKVKVVGSKISPMREATKAKAQRPTRAGNSTMGAVERALSRAEVPGGELPCFWLAVGRPEL